MANPLPEDDTFMSVTQVAELFVVTPETVRNWIKQEKLAAIQINGQYRIRRSEVVRLANSKYGPD